jgi:peptidoglycan hydrolase FlgJ
MDQTFAMINRASVARAATAPIDPIRAKAEELEGVFLNTLVAEMFKGLETDGMFGGGHAEETWRGMLSEQYASEMAKSGGVGLADQIVATLIQTQEHAQSASHPYSVGAYTR